MSMAAKYTIYAVDRAGNSWTVDTKQDPAFALACLNRERSAMRVKGGTAGVYLTDDEEAGDQESKLMEECE
jgi:hypothetical protein